MKKITILYWAFTGLFAFMMFGSAVPDALSVEMAQEGFKSMNMPTYLLPFLGIAKMLGVIAILVPGFPRIKEWAYAGLVFDLLGATYSIIASGQPVASWAFMALPLSLAAASYYFYHKRLAAVRSAEALAQPSRVPSNTLIAS
ncbi:DoxX-like family protein [Catalinimonas alkaloidigena]|uniref:DoxX-like family protein n=1 Tax=Catalinimonas alkaloidigena TaxID=1075417 RepID=A0A1G8X5G7_9BACT|nr:DoxX family protein [Catalinimonas alkaloidigena]SDJ85721.1 DoxX-like family protein [Catalinimonas alkaloidigena]